MPDADIACNTMPYNIILYNTTQHITYAKVIQGKQKIGEMESSICGVAYKCMQSCRLPNDAHGIYLSHEDLPVYLGKDV